MQQLCTLPLAAAVMFIMCCAAASAAAPRSPVTGRDMYTLSHIEHHLDVETEGHAVLLASSIIDTRRHPQFHEDEEFLAHAQEARERVQSDGDTQEPKHQFIVAFSGPIKEPMKAAVAAVIKEPLAGFLPHHAFIVYCTQRQMDELRHAVAAASDSDELRHVSWLGYHHPRHRVTAALQSMEPQTMKKHDQRLKGQPHLQMMLPPVPRGSRTKAQAHAFAGELLSRLKTSRPDLAEDVHMYALTHRFVEVRVWRGKREHDNRADFFDKPQDANDVIETDEEVAQHRKEIVEWLTHQTECYVLFPWERVITRNKWARGTIQGNVDLPDYTTRTGLIGWDHNLLGQGQVVGSADSGADPNSCYFTPDGSALPQFKVRVDDSRKDAGTSHDLQQRKLVHYITAPSPQDNVQPFPGGGDPFDEDGHGTHVMGSIAGNTHDSGHSDGLGPFEGIAYEAKIAAFDIGFTNNAGENRLDVPNNYEDDMFEWSYVAGARIHSDSWGTTSNSYLGGDMQFDSYSAAKKDWLGLVAAGNDGPDPNQCGSPANAKNILSVAAGVQGQGMWTEYFTDINPSSGSLNFFAGTQADHFTSNSVASFSSSGPSADRRIKPDVTAPGELVVSAATDQPGGASCSSSASINDRTVALQGTSMATPVLAGAVAMVRQYYTEGFYPSGRRSCGGFSPSGALMKATVINSAQELTGDRQIGGGSTYESVARAQHGYPNRHQGYGRPQLDQALFFGGSRTLWIAQQDNEGADPALATGEEHSYGPFCIAAAGPELPKFTLVWTDPEASPGSTKRLINDLDLRVIDGASQVTFGNNEVETDTIGVPGRNTATTADHTNNVEQVVLRNAAVGSCYTVTVTAFQVAVNSPQEYSLVATGHMSTPAALSGRDCTTDDSQAIAGISSAAGLAVIGAAVIVGILAFKKKKRGGGGDGTVTGTSKRAAAAAANRYKSPAPAATGGVAAAAARWGGGEGAARVAPPVPSRPRPAGPPPIRYPWTIYKDDDGNPYYYNEMTQQSQWERPQ